MPKFAIYQALMARNDWDRERRDKAMNLQALEKSTAITQQKQQAQLQAQQQLGEFLQTVDNLDYEPEDIERLQELEEKERGNIIEGIRKANGDVRSYMASGGLMALNNYKTNIIKSKEAKNAIATKESMAGYIKDRQDGKYISSGYVDVPIGDGKMERRYMSMNEQIALFRDKKIDKITYFGSEKKVNVDMMDFKKVAKDALRPYGDNTVTMSDVKQMAIGKGASPEQAEQIAQDVAKVWAESKQGWKWGGSSISDYNLKVAEHNRKVNADTNRQLMWEWEQYAKEKQIAMEEKYITTLTGANYQEPLGKDGKPTQTTVNDEWLWKDGSVGAKFTQQPLTVQQQHVFTSTGLGVDMSQLPDRNKAIFNEDKEVDSDMFEINKFPLPTGYGYSTRSGQKIQLQNINHHVLGFDNKIGRVQPRNGKEGNLDLLGTRILVDESGLEKIKNQYGNANFNQDFTYTDGTIKKHDRSGYFTGDYYEITIMSEPRKDPNATREGNLNFLESKTKEEMGSGMQRSLELNAQQDNQFMGAMNSIGNQ